MCMVPPQTPALCAVAWLLLSGGAPQARPVLVVHPFHLSAWCRRPAICMCRKHHVTVVEPETAAMASTAQPAPGTPANERTPLHPLSSQACPPRCRRRRGVGSVAPPSASSTTLQMGTGRRWDRRGGASFEGTAPRACREAAWTSQVAVVLHWLTQLGRGNHLAAMQPGLMSCRAAAWELLGYSSSQHVAPGACGICHGMKCMSGLLHHMLQSLLPARLCRLVVCELNLGNWSVPRPGCTCHKEPVARLGSQDSSRAPGHSRGIAGCANSSFACRAPPSPAAFPFELFPAFACSFLSMLQRRSAPRAALLQAGVSRRCPSAIASSSGHKLQAPEKRAAATAGGSGGRGRKIPRGGGSRGRGRQSSPRQASTMAFYANATAGQMQSMQLGSPGAAACHPPCCLTLPCCPYCCHNGRSA